RSSSLAWGRGKLRPKSVPRRFLPGWLQGKPDSSFFPFAPGSEAPLREESQHRLRSKPDSSSVSKIGQRTKLVARRVRPVFSDAPRRLLLLPRTCWVRPRRRDAPYGVSPSEQRRKIGRS